VSVTCHVDSDLTWNNDFGCTAIVNLQAHLICRSWAVYYSKVNALGNSALFHCIAVTQTMS
jgi:hypothetical protein